MISPKQKSQQKSEISVNFSVNVYISKNLQMGSNTLRTRIINYNQLICEATMCFECCPVFRRWVKFSCITMFQLLDHLRQRLIGELIGYSWSVRRPSFTMLKDLLLRNHLTDQSQILCGASLVGGTKVCSRHVGHMTKIAAQPIYGKNPSKIFSRTGGPIFRKLGM